MSIILWTPEERQSILKVSPGTAALTNTTEDTMTIRRYTITDSDKVSAIGLPKFMLGTWDHYNTQDGMVRLARVSGRGRKFTSLRASDFAMGVEVGLFVEVN